MKASLLLLGLLFGVTFAANQLVVNEVVAILATYPGISIEDCTKKCDSIFELLDPADESTFDNQCSQQCSCQINHNCPYPDIV